MSAKSVGEISWGITHGDSIYDAIFAFAELENRDSS